ncbi:DUF6415 family natural product biosynthesis protein [Streptomyces sp. NPDC057052]|uniref:DUF6415 family natural product biosynthesis protein n=1 Tax=Streptomyces sp. NPDC057052 TaxID=3346010 RepID=UPI003644571F
MNHPTEQAAPPHRDYEPLIAEALAATGILPTIDDCRRLNAALRDAIGDLADQVRRRQDRTPREDAAWQACEDALLRAQGALCGDLGLGLRSAALHVEALGQAVHALAACAAEA